LLPSQPKGWVTEQQAFTGASGHIPFNWLLISTARVCCKALLLMQASFRHDVLCWVQLGLTTGLTVL
jgi:hypothetical protein